MDNSKLLTVSNRCIKQSNSEDENKTEIQMVLAKMMEEKHTYTYKKLVVPISMRSIYWKFFGFPATEYGDILTKVKIVCVLCKTQIAYNRNTSNLRMHLQNKHGQELLELESGNPPKRQILSQEAKDRRTQKRLIKAGLTTAQHIYTTTADGTVQIDGDIQFVTDPNVNLSNIEDDIGIDQPITVTIKGGTSSNNNQNIDFLMPENNPIHQPTIDNKTLSDAIAEFIIMDMQLPEVVEGRGFHRLIATLKSPCEIPSKNKLEEDIIPKVYETFKDSVAANLSCITSEFGLAVEEWRSNSGECFVTLSVFYQNPGEASLECKVLNTLHAPIEWTEAQWGNDIDAILSSWDLRIDRITAAIVATGRDELLMALTNRGLTTIPCLLFSLQVCAQACFDSIDVSQILTKCRMIIGAIDSNLNAMRAFGLEEQMAELGENSMVMDYPAVWTSTYNMMEQMVLRRNIISSLLETMEGIDRETVELTSDQWKIMEDLVAVLEPFKVTILTLSEEKMPLISLLRPLLWQLVSSHLKIKEGDSEIARTFKESLSDMLCDRYADGNVTLLLQIATTLDPRFKQLPYATEEDKNMVTTPIKEMLTKLIQEDTGNQTVVKQEPEPPSKKSRMSGMELLLGGLCSAKTGMPAEEKADLELVQYQSEATAPLDYCPLQWWARISAKCPNLGRLARRYNCVPACCAPPSRIPAELQILYDTKRAALPTHLVDKLLFLHGNHIV